MDIAIATVRPATMLADVAVAVHPDDERYRDLRRQGGRRPLRRAPCPGHRRRSRRAGVRHRRAQDHARPRSDRLRDRPRPRPARADRDRPRRAHERRGAGDLAGKTQQEAGEARPRLADATTACSRSGSSYRHAVGSCERCHTRIEPLISLQWWCAMEEPRQPALARGARAPRPLPPRVAAPVRDPLARGDPRLVHLAPALVGPPAADLVLPGRARHLCVAAAGRVRRVRLGRARARPGRARHLVLVRAVALRDARLAGADARAEVATTPATSTPPRARSSVPGRTG